MSMSRLGRYELRGTLGEGGFATVYRAFDPALGREVALKALHPHLAANPGIRQRFLAEARALARMRHPHIVTVHDVSDAAERPFFTMERIEGRTLADLAPGQALPPAQVVTLITSLASAVDALHHADLVHRDIKAANVMVDRGGRVVLMDLGIARVLNATQHTQTGAVLGTLESMAPEQVRGQPVGPPADIYALGILAYQLLAGRPPFQGDTAYLLHAHVYDPPPPLQQMRPGLPPSVCAAVEAALAKDPARRPASAGQFAAMLAGTVSPPRTPSGPPPRPPRTPTTPLPPTVVERCPGRSPLLVVGMGVAAGVIVATGIVGLVLARGVGRSDGTTRAGTIAVPGPAGTVARGPDPKQPTTATTPAVTPTPTQTQVPTATPSPTATPVPVTPTPTRPPQPPAEPNLSLPPSSEANVPAPKVISVTPLGPAFADGSFEFRVVARNVGVGGGRGSITVSSPNTTNVTAVSGSCTTASGISTVRPGQVITTLGGGTATTRGQIPAVHWAAEVAPVETWPANGECNLVIRAPVPSSGDMTFLVRAAIYTRSAVIKYWPYGSGPDIQVDQQDYPAIFWVVPVERR
jgi:serine/threonine protein kinase